MLLELVLTAHPTEATRRTFLQSQLQLGGLLDRLDDPRRRPPQRAAVERALAEQTTMLWQTDEVRSVRPSVSDEVRQGLWFFERACSAPAASWRMSGPELPRRAAAAALRHLDRRRPGRPPRCGAAELRDALARARGLLMRRYRDEVRELARSLGMSDALAGAVAELLALDRARRARAALGSPTRSASETPTSRTGAS